MKELRKYWKGCCERAQIGDVLQYVMRKGLCEEIIFMLNVIKCKKELCVEAGLCGSGENSMHRSPT